MKISGLGWALTGALALLLAINWCNGDRRDRELAAALARADSLRRVSDSLDTVREADSIIGARAVARLADSVRRAAVMVQRTRGRADSLNQALAAVADTMVPKAQALEALAAKDTVIGAQAVQIDALAADTVAWADRWASAMRAASSWRLVALKAEEQLDASNKRHTPRWGCTGGVTGMVAVLGGSGGGFGVTCGRHL